MKKKALPVNIEDFSELIREGYYFVDKTLFIKKLLDSKSKVTLFTRPRRFGKTMSMSMLEHFFDCTHAEENRQLFDGLKIAEAGDEYMNEQGKYPVISFSLKDVKSYDPQQIMEDLRNALQRTFKYYAKLADICEDLLNCQRDTLRSFAQKQTQLSGFRTALVDVCEALYKVYGRSVVLLIDEYDAPLQSAYTNGAYDPMRDFLRSFLGSAIKTNKYLHKAVLTGVTRVSKESIFSGLNNLEVDTLLDVDFADCFGFTQNEVEALAEYYGYGEKLAEIKYWYDGYRFGNLDIYNPLSVLKYCKAHGVAAAYWCNTSDNELPFKLLRKLSPNNLDNLWKLRNGSGVLATLTPNLVYHPGSLNTMDAVYSLMTIAGYLKPVQKIDERRYLLQVPNHEIQSIFEEEIIKRVAELLGGFNLDTLGDAFIDGQPKIIADSLRELLLSSSSYYDNRESYYQGLLMGLFVHLRGKYDVQSNREAGDGRADFLLRPLRDYSLPAIVLELKQSDNEAELPQLASAGMNQIEEKHYIAAFPKECRKVFVFSLAFSKKQVQVEFRDLSDR